MTRYFGDQRKRPLTWRLRLLDRFTNYRTRYGYPPMEAFFAEMWWRLEHSPLSNVLGAYRRRKDWERRGAALRIGHEDDRPIAWTGRLPSTDQASSDVRRASDPESES